MTDPHHPLFGRELELLSLACSRGPAFIAVALPDGRRRRLLRRAATDLEQLPAPQAALPCISARALLPLARHIRSMLAASSKPPEVRLVLPGTFAAWMRRHGKLGGQNKVPRVINDPALLADLDAFARET